MSDTSKTAKIIRRWYYSTAHWQLGDVIVSDITFLWFLLLSMCHSLHVAINKCINWCFVHLLFIIIETRKRKYLTQKHAFWAINGRDRSFGVTCRREQEYKKGSIDRTQKVTENALPTQPPFPSSYIKQILPFGSYPEYLSWFWVSSKSVEKCGSCGESKFRLSHWLGTSLIQQLVATAQAVKTVLS